MPRHGGDRAPSTTKTRKSWKPGRVAADEALQVVDAADSSGAGRSRPRATRRRPAPCEPNSGLSTSGPAPRLAPHDVAARPRALRPSRSAAPAARRVRGGSWSSTCRRSARSPRALVPDRHAERLKACRMPSRRVTASKVPPRSCGRGRRPAGVASRERAGPTRAVCRTRIARSGRRTASTPRRRTRAASSRACQSRVDAQSATRATRASARLDRRQANEASSELGPTRAGAERLRRSRAPSPAPRAGLNSMRVDGVEIAAEAL